MCHCWYAIFVGSYTRLRCTIRFILNYLLTYKRRNFVHPSIWSFGLRRHQYLIQIFFDEWTCSIDNYFLCANLWTPLDDQQPINTQLFHKIIGFCWPSPRPCMVQIVLTSINTPLTCMNWNYYSFTFLSATNLTRLLKVWRSTLFLENLQMANNPHYSRYRSMFQEFYYIWGGSSNNVVTTKHTKKSKKLLIDISLPLQCKGKQNN